MLTLMPDTVQKALGDVAVRDFTVWLETVMTEHAVGQDAWSQAQVRFDNLETRLDGLETGQAKLEAGQAKLEIRMTNVETRLTMVEHDVADLKVDVRELRRDVHERFDRQTAEMNTRFGEVTARLDHQGAEMNTRFDQLHVQMLSQTRWMVGSFALFGTLIAILVGIGQLRP